MSFAELTAHQLGSIERRILWENREILQTPYCLIGHNGDGDLIYPDVARMIDMIDGMYDSPRARMRDRVIFFGWVFKTIQLKDVRGLKDAKDAVEYRWYCEPELVPGFKNYPDKIGVIKFLLDCALSRDEIINGHKNKREELQTSLQALDAARASTIASIATDNMRLTEIDAERQHVQMQLEALRSQ